MKLTRSLKLLITGDSDAAKLFDHTLEAAEDAATVVAEQNSGVMKVAAAATGVVIPLGGVTTARSILIASDKDIVVRLNGGAAFTPAEVIESARTGSPEIGLAGSSTPIRVPGAQVLELEARIAEVKRMFQEGW